MPENNVDIYVRFLIDQAAQGNAARSIESLENQISDFEDAIASLKQEAASFITVSERLGVASRGLLAGGTAITGGIFAFAAKYVKDAKVATEVTENWEAAQRSLSESGQRAGAVLAETALPLLEKAAELAEKASGFVEENPEIVRAALNTGVLIAGLGAIGVAVSKGIRIYADYLYLAAVAKEAQGFAFFDKAVNKFLAGTATFGRGSGAATAVGAGGAGAAGTAGIGGALATIATTLGSLVAGGLLGDKIGEAIAKKLDPTDTADFSASDYINVLKQLIAVDSFYYAEFILGQEKGLKVFEAVAKFLGLRQTQDAGGGEELTGVRASDAFEQILAAYEKYRDDDLKLVNDHYAERKKIVDDSLAQEQAATRKMQEAVSKVRSDSGRQIAKATRDFRQNEVKAEADYINQRAEIIRDSGEEIAKIERDLRERLRKMALDHDERLSGLVRSRDALGIVKEQRRYDRERAEAVRASNEQIRQRRRDIAIRLRDLQATFERERAERLIEFQQRLAEIRANAAARIAELQAEHRAELSEIRKQRAEKLKQLQREFIEERQRRHEAFIRTVRDLDASLLGEQQLKQKYYKDMEADLNRFLANYRNGLKTLQSNATESRATGGYASFGTYRLGDTPGGGRGRPEFVMSGSTTDIAERALGGQLTQEKMIAALTMGGGGNQVNYQDNRRMPATGAVDREMLRKDMVSIMNKELKHAFR